MDWTHRSTTCVQLTTLLILLKGQASLPSTAVRDMGKRFKFTQVGPVKSSSSCMIFLHSTDAVNKMNFKGYSRSTGELERTLGYQFSYLVGLSKTGGLKRCLCPIEIMYVKRILCLKFQFMHKLKKFVNKFINKNKNKIK